MIGFSVSMSSEGSTVIPPTHVSSDRSEGVARSSDPIIAPVSVVQYGDFQCLECGRAATTIKLFRERFRSLIRFDYHHFPQRGHEHAVQAAEAAECARAQRRFWPMHDLLMANQDRLDLQFIYDYAEDIRLDMRRFTTEMDDEVHLPKVQADVKGGLEIGVYRTPTFLVNGQLVDISSGLSALFEATERAVGKARGSNMLFA